MPHQLADRRLLERQRRDAAAVAHHGDAMADAVDLVEAMSDVDNGDAARGQPLDQRRRADRLRAR